MKQAINIAIALLLTGLISACSPYRVIRNQADKGASWSAYKTFAFIDTAGIARTPRPTYGAAMEQIKQAVKAQLQSRGYQLTTDNPDLLVNLGAVVQEKTQTRQTTIREAPVYMGQRRYSWRSQEVPVSTYEEGTVNLHIVDAQKNALVWDVAVSSVLTRRSLSAEQIEQAVAKVFGKFPGKAD
ncbi:DUF4136 domain-containing protein [Rudanella lutea]|uniref:DUF4136 domain-containing protein n=1 Tax=Rudanella lutea TaxID=451374 RepID=UPI00037A2534|nr:DUF4136 domain-containing protein [Rudanella lutea]